MRLPGLTPHEREYLAAEAKHYDVSPDLWVALCERALTRAYIKVALDRIRYGHPVKDVLAEIMMECDMQAERVENTAAELMSGRRFPQVVLGEG